METVTRYVLERSLRGGRGETLLRWLLDHGADEFSITVMALQGVPAPVADAFEDAMGSFELARAPRRVPSSPASLDSTRVVRLWTLSEESLALLLGFFPLGLFHSAAGPDGWFEDLAIYRAGELLLGILSHEGEGVLCLTADEHAAVAALGIGSEAGTECTVTVHSPNAN